MAIPGKWNEMAQFYIHDVTTFSEPIDESLNISALRTPFTIPTSHFMVTGGIRSAPKIDNVRYLRSRRKFPLRTSINQTETQMIS
jgi:hypothetical protein